MEASLAKLCRYGKLREIKTLCKMNYNINIHYYDGKAFRNCCRYGHVKTAKFLLSQFPDIRDQEYCNEAFQEACNNNRFNIINFFVENSFDFKFCIFHKGLMDACQNSNIDLLEIIFNGCIDNHDENIFDEYDGWDDLMEIAINQNNLQIIKLLFDTYLDKYQNLSYCGEVYYIDNAFAEACRQDNFDIIKFICSDDYYFDWIDTRILDENWKFCIMPII